MRLIEVVDIPNFAAAMELEFWKVGAQQNGVEKLGAHVGILHLENVAYSNLPEIFVNDLSHNGTSSLRIPLKGKVLTLGSSLQPASSAEFGRIRFVEKLRMAEDNWGRRRN